MKLKNSFTFFALLNVMLGTGEVVYWEITHDIYWLIGGCYNLLGAVIYLLLLNIEKINKCNRDYQFVMLFNDMRYNFYSGKIGKEQFKAWFSAYDLVIDDITDNELSKKIKAFRKEVML